MPRSTNGNRRDGSRDNTNTNTNNNNNGNSAGNSKPPAQPVIDRTGFVNSLRRSRKGNLWTRWPLAFVGSNGVGCTVEVTVTIFSVSGYSSVRGAYGGCDGDGWTGGSAKFGVCCVGHDNLPRYSGEGYDSETEGIQGALAMLAALQTHWGSAPVVIVPPPPAPDPMSYDPGEPPPLYEQGDEEEPSVDPTGEDGPEGPAL
jgi:hypothetical protein